MIYLQLIIQIMKKPRFKPNESYLHLHAKRVLTSWLAYDYIRIVEEEKFCIGGCIWFTPDLSCYNEKGLADIYEIVNTNDVDVFKQWRINLYLELHKWDVNVYTIDANWIMRQTAPPQSINMLKIL